MNGTLSDEAQLLVDYCQRKLSPAEDVHKKRCERWAKWYGLYRSYQDFKRSHADATPRDVDSILNDARGVFDHDLFIPYVYATVETQLPRMLSQNPKMNLTPAPVWPGAVPNMDIGRLEEHADTLKLVYDRYQTLMSYPLTVQDIGKSGLIYGFGAGKMDWRHELRRSHPRIQPSIAPSQGNPWVVGKFDKTTYMGPYAEQVDIFDLLIDPTAWDIRTTRYLFHRTWRDGDYARKMVETGAWVLPAGVELADLMSTGTDEGRDSVWSERMEAAGITNAEKRRGGEAQHEVLEFHDGEDVITLWDRVIPVQVGALPHWHAQIPFSYYRPTKIPNELIGIGEPEAVEQLQFEMNAHRTIRLANAAVVVQRPFAYFQGLADPGDFEFGPAAMWPVDGDPSSLISAIPLQDLPASAYQEEQSLKADIERTTGVNDQENGGGGNDMTATQAQLVHSAVNQRIANKTMLLTEETITPQARMMLSLLQQHITEEIYIAGPPRRGEAPGQVWSYYVLSPEVMEQDWLVEADGGSMAPENTPQMRDDATRLWNMFGQDPFFEPVWLRQKVAEKMGLKDAQAHITPPVPQVPLPMVGEMLQLLAGEVAQAGIDPGAFMQAGEQALSALEAQQQQGAQPGGGGPPKQQPSGEPAPVQ